MYIVACVFFRDVKDSDSKSHLIPRVVYRVKLVHFKQSCSACFYAAVRMWRAHVVSERHRRRCAREKAHARSKVDVWLQDFRRKRRA